MSYVRSFAPWIAYAVVSSFTDWRVASFVALVVAARGIRDQRREYGDVDDLTLMTKWFFAGLAFLAVVEPGSPLHRYTPALSLAALGGAALVSLARRRPFTLTIAKRTAPRELWNTKVFYDANVTITSVWAARFLATAAVCATVLTAAPHATALWIAAEVLGFVIPVRFTAIYRERLRVRFAAAA